MRTQTALLALACIAPLACSSARDADGPVDGLASSASTTTPRPAARLWILNQGGDPSLEDFFTCMLVSSNWNALATAYAGAPTLTLGKHVLVHPDSSGRYPCTSQVGSQGYYQCAADAGAFPIASGDLLLVVQPDGSVGGLDNAFSSDPTNIAYGPNHGQMSVTNPFTKQSVPIVGAHVGNATSSNPQYLFVYAGHEVFEGQTDGISADCCDGETASGGPLPACPDCGPYRTGGGYGKCGQYAAPGGSYGIASITCPSGKAYLYQRVSPPGAHRYGSPEFDGTCNAITTSGRAPNPCANVPSSGNGLYCGRSTEDGFAGGDPDTLYDCRDGATVSTTACPNGCFIAPAGTADGCN
jgi:hypothetical protein